MSNITNATQAIDAALSATGSKVTYAGAGMTIGGWVLSSEFAVLFGMIIGTLGLVVNWFYRHRLTMVEIKLRHEAAEREKEEHIAKMEKYK